MSGSFQTLDSMFPKDPFFFPDYFFFSDYSDIYF